MLPCTCGHQESAHAGDDGSCVVCGCLAFMAEGSNCEPLTESEQARGVSLGERGCRAGDDAA